jgi:DedD protein
MGFGLGVIAGLILEEPNLVLDYVAGRTETVALEEGAEPRAFDTEIATTPDVAARPPGSTTDSEYADDSDPLIAAPLLDARGAMTTEESGPAARIEPPSGDFAIQVGAFSEASSAEQLAQRLRLRGLSVYVAASTVGGAGTWRVRVGPLASRAEADALAGQLERDEQLSTWVLTESPL